MSQQFIGEIRMFAGNFAPIAWAYCNGQLLAISDYSPLYNLIGTTYGGDGQTTFALPNLQCRVPIHMGTGPSGTYVMGQVAGEESHTLTVQQMPSHSHTVRGMGQATTNSVAGNLYAGGGLRAYKAAPGGTMNPAVVKNNAGGQAHDNMMPFLAINFIIALYGIYPSQG